jgi:hypothetical protein
MIMMSHSWCWSSLQLTGQADFWHPTGQHLGGQVRQQVCQPGRVVAGVEDETSSVAAAYESISNDEGRTAPKSMKGPALPNLVCTRATDRPAATAQTASRSCSCARSRRGQPRLVQPSACISASPTLVYGRI